MKIKKTELLKVDRVNITMSFTPGGKHTDKIYDHFVNSKPVDLSKFGFLGEYVVHSFNFVGGEMAMIEVTFSR